MREVEDMHTACPGNDVRKKEALAQADRTLDHDSDMCLHYLHPRSRPIGPLLTATLAVSFPVVSVPHLLPCPVDRRQYADAVEMSDGMIKRRRWRRQEVAENGDVSSESDGGEEEVTANRPPRESPVSKPRGLVG